MKVLAVVAHPDDEVIGMGGTLASHAASGDEVHVLVLSDGESSRHDEATPERQRAIEERREQARTACERLGVDSVSFHDFPDNAFDTVPLLDVVQRIESTVESVQPDVVYTHHYGDLNVDHELTCRATLTATRPLSDSPVRRVLAAETLSATEWGTPSANNAFQPTTFVDVADQLERKLEALEAYEGELKDEPHPRTVQTIGENASVWGAKAGLEAAEPFELLRERVDHAGTNTFR